MVLITFFYYFLVAGTYATIEPFIPSNHDLIIQKIGKIYKAYQRQSKQQGQWHHACGEVTIDRVAVTESHKMWLDCAAELFGGLDLVSLTCLQDPQNPNSYIIMKINGSWMSLFELENVQYISDIIWHRLCTSVRRKNGGGQNIGQAESVGTGLNQRYSQSSASLQNQSGVQRSNGGMSRNVSVGGQSGYGQQNVMGQSNNVNMQQQNFNQNPNNNGVHRNRTQSMPVSPDHTKTVPGQLPNQQGQEESAEKIRQIRQSFANFFN